MLQLQTSNRKAFEYYHAAMLKVADYYQTLNSAMLDQALQYVDRSLEFDPNYFEPLNFKGILFDMKGMFREAVEMYTRISSVTTGSMQTEVIYNRAVANYHLYQLENIKASIADLSDLINSNAADPRQEALIYAALGQAYAMMVHHEQKKYVNDVEKYATMASTAADESLKIITKNSAFETTVVNQVKWVAYNAKGVSLMFQDDAMRDRIDTNNQYIYRKRLVKAFSLIKKATEYSPKNWALKCNEGSILMRLGHLYEMIGQREDAVVMFKRAESALQQVLQNLNPNYDFAFYEIGRIYRFLKDKDQAISYFNKAIDAGGSNASIRQETIEWNIRQAKSESILFRSESVS